MTTVAIYKNDSKYYMYYNKSVMPVKPKRIEVNLHCVTSHPSFTIKLFVQYVSSHCIIATIIIYQITIDKNERTQSLSINAVVISTPHKY